MEEKTGGLFTGNHCFACWQFLHARSTLAATRSCRVDFLFYTIILIVLITAMVSSPATGQSSRVLRAGVYQNFPKIFIDKNGLAAGIFIEILDEIAIQEGWEIQYIPCEWNACLDALEAGQIDLMPDVAFSIERSEKFDFHKTPVLESWSGVYANPNTPINTISQLEGKRVAVLNGSIQHTVFEQTMNGYGYRASIIPVDSLEQAFTYAANGKADAAIANHFFGDYFYEEYGLSKTTLIFNPSKLHFATSKDSNPDILMAIDKHLNNWLEQPYSFYYTTLIKWTERKPDYQIPNYLFWIIGGVAGLCLVAIGGVLTLRSQVAARTRKLEHALMDLQQSEQRYQTLAMISPVGIFRTDPNGATTYVNARWQEISGLSTNQAMGYGWLNAVHPEDHERISHGWRITTQTQFPLTSDYRYVRPDGTISWVMGLAAPEFNVEGQITGYIGVITDITDRKNVEDEIIAINKDLERRVQERTRELEIAHEQLIQQERLALIGQLAAGVGHELRNPLGVISNAAYFLKLVLPDADTKVKSYLDIIDAEVHIAEKTIVDLLDFSRSKAPTVVDVSISELILGAFQRQPVPGEILVEQDFATTLPHISADPQQIIHALSNLLVNAYQSMPQGGQLTIRARTVSHNKQEGVAIDVIDKGVGIQQEIISKIFNPLFTTKARGIGMGLPVAQKLVEANHGFIDVLSQPEQGSTFTIWLPIFRRSDYSSDTELGKI